jgi:hypothetical protein
VMTSATISRPPLINCSTRNCNTLASPLHDFLCDRVSIKERRLEGCRRMQDKTLSRLSLRSLQVRSLIGQHIHGMAHEVKQSKATSSVERGEGMCKAVETWSPNVSQRWAAITAPHDLTHPSGKETLLRTGMGSNNLGSKESLHGWVWSNNATTMKSTCEVNS